MQTARVAIEAADWNELGPRLLQYAHYEIVGVRWRGLVMPGSSYTSVTINNRTGAEIVQDALQAIWDGKRTWQSELSLELNLKGAIWSIVRNHYKAANRSVIVGRVEREDDGTDSDLIENASDPTTAANPTEVAERRQRQNKFFNLLSENVADDGDLSLLLIALASDITGTGKIAEETGIPAKRISELKRKLEERADKLMRKNPEYADLKPQKVK